MHHHLAVDPLPARSAQSLLHVLSGQEPIHFGEVVAEGGVFALLPDVVDIESGGHGQSQNGGDSQLAPFQSRDPDARLDETLAGQEARLEQTVLH